MRDDTKVNTSSKLEERGSQKELYLLKKEQNARKRRLAKEVQDIEGKISLLENKKREFDSIFQDTTLYSNKEKSVEINKQYKIITDELSSLYKRWETVHAELVSICDN